MKEPLVVATVVNWNGRELTLRLLRSLEKTAYPNLKVIAVDNASNDGSVEAIRLSHPSVEVIVLPRNRGYSAGINAGLERAQELGAEYHWVFNNDVEIETGALDLLLKEMEADPKVGVAGPIVYDFTTGEIAHAGYRINMWLGRMTELGRPVAESAYEVDSAFGCSNLIRAAALKDVGGFDESFNVYFDETDFNARAQKNGWKVVVVPDARVRHEESATMNMHIISKAWLLLKNLFKFEMKNATRLQLAVFIPYYFVIHIPLFLLRGSLHAIRIRLAAGHTTRMGGSA